MTKKSPQSLRTPPEKRSARSAVLSALSLLSASMDLSLNDVATADDKTKTLQIQNDVTTHKAKTADKNYDAMKGYIEQQKVKPGSTGPTVPPKPTSGSHK